MKKRLELFMRNKLYIGIGLILAFLLMDKFGTVPVPISIGAFFVIVVAYYFNEMKERMEIAEAKNLSPHVVTDNFNTSFSTLFLTQNWALFDVDGINSTFKEFGKDLLICPRFATFKLGDQAVCFGMVRQIRKNEMPPECVEIAWNLSFDKFYIVESNFNKKPFMIKQEGLERPFYKEQLIYMYDMNNSLRRDIRIKKTSAIDRIDEYGVIKQSLDSGEEIEIPEEELEEIEGGA